ncbi:plexin-B1 isoform X2 [Strongylocentrotus purpuratus]|nr:plexin-B1 isoform X2 [Strongylocentrotus purpuratus]XP_030856006.1 plexin-B1 isoform X2 [Strongylocentrotus purpuratus]XP_030856008.1 plexin-B1 isoform X2 [Strongylocentrotus purpuratus]XP_030856009.1 plexin-B1 isoform X2 [Strongylocentrotus purpuratus]XP_030856010.1 plexin-B1 isoform X2 [Strongylocentrotus purpuratus]
MAGVHFLKMRGFLPVLTVLFICLTQTIYSAPLSSYLVSSFKSPDPTLPFNHITINNITGDVYIGARQRLYQLNSDLTLKHSVDTGQCSNINNNKLLLVAPSPEDKLITCGSCDGYCETRSLTNISHDVVKYDFGTIQRVVTTSDAPNVGAVFLGADFVSNGEGTVDGGLYLFTGSSDANANIRSVSKHSLVDLRPVQRVSAPASSTTQAICKHLITYMEYLYYFISRGDSVYLGRLCRNSLDDDFESYTEIELQCESHDGIYNVIQSAHIGPAGSQLADSFSIESTDDLLYAVFTSESSSALCIYKMSDVLQSFEDAVLGCIQEDKNDLGTKNVYFGDSFCNSFPDPYTPPETAQCTAYIDEDPPVILYRYASGTFPLSASPIFTIPDVICTSIVTTIERQHTVAFMGDTQGYLHKVNIVNSSFGYVYENVPLESGSVLQDIFLDESTEQITLATSSDQGSQILTLDLTNCTQYQTCNECIGGNGGNAGDPYCGWCTLEARCTRYEACPLRDESTRWLSYNALQCVSISDVQPNSLPYHQTQQEIIITVQQLPDLRSTFQYMCAFNSYEVSATTTGNTVTCTSPPANGIPTIPDGMYFLNLPLSVVSNETSVDFVTTDFFFFDCSHIKSCSSCVTTRFPCDWCVYDNQCTDDSSPCQTGDTVVIGENNTDGAGNKGQGFCPQLLGATESFLIPVGIPSGYSLSAKNLPTDQSKGQVTYECILDIEGKEVRVPSTTFNETYILCNDEQYMYNENVLEKNVSVSVQWNEQNSIDDLSETHVTLYKCSVNSGSCSRCLSQDATPSILKCGWCGDDCNVVQSEVCKNNQFLHQNETHLCSAPVITDFDPLSGPINGQTRLEIIGTDIGVVFDDVLQIFIQDLECDLNNMGEYYQPGQSVSCMTAISTEVISGGIEITVVSGEGNKTGQSTKEFQYRDPVITGFDPREGPVAGGTEITINGMYLDTGRDITASFRDADCVVISVQDSFATCITSSIPENEQVTVTLAMTFDGEERPFSDYTFTYMPNPRIDNIDRTTSIMSGGLDITLTGVRFDLIQEPRINVTSLTTNASNSELCNGTETILKCPTPSFPDDAIPARRRRATDDAMIANLSFDFDGNVIDGGTIEYFPDPVYVNFSGNSRIYKSANKRLEITGMDLTLASTEDDVLVLLGPDGECTVDDLGMNVLRCQLPDVQPQAGNLNGTLGQGDAKNLPAVTVKHGNLWFYPGFVQYSTNTGPSIGLIVGPTVGSLVVIIIVMGLAGRFLVKRRQKAIDQQVDELELLEKKIQNRAEEAYHNLQVDMTEVEDQVKGLGIPFVNTQDYARNMLFSGLDILPATADPEYLDADLERAMITFSRQLNNPDFLVKYIQELEERRKSQRRDRVNIASLITVILVSEGNFDYFTKILKRLLEDQISDASDTGRQLKSLFRRTETIVEKLLANWFSLCMYHYLKKHVAKSLYLLYQSIKIQVEKGPIDIITGQSYFSLNFDCLIEEDVPYEEMSLSVVGADGQHEYYVTVLSSDCISQTKQKILDAAYRRQHFVKQSRAHELDLLWYHPGGEQRILRDQDEYNTPTDTSMAVQVNTLRSVGVTTDCRMAMINKVGNLEGHTGSYTPVSPGAKSFYIYEQQGNTDVRDRDYTRIQTQREGFQHCHLLPEDHLQANGDPSKTKLDKEFSAPHLLVTKKTIEPFLNQFLAAVFENPDLTPVTIKNFFDFYDGMASKYCPNHPQDYSEAWKSNSLPQHYWVTTLTHPSYIFDMRQSRSADQSVSVLANMLDNACKKIIPEKNQDSSLNRVLFVKDLPRYIRTISDYYKNLASRPEPTHIELQGEFNRLGQEFSGLFSRVGTLKLLYDFTHHDTAGLLDSITEMM